ncbi:hypothetical protein UFOVP32_40 [uncultured Caudovirales phage]|uniref:Uncharacterized protein n=1 Tax=uncultured Caudovirales phage TaxID=2100421 RepID=A0A6J5KMJ9_9CAUD|nr:hypothetical protein UFOVP32_40 [uncultured Caudovirales phage]CAB4123655.1 hypothetical protein UFOVP50_36 [uncultured Caudovirales phage]
MTDNIKSPIADLLNTFCHTNERLMERIEKLEVGDKEWQRICDSYADENQRFSDRIEKLEAALDDVAGYLARADWHYLKPETRKALEGKDD